jgi:hypothetical protein
MKPAKLVQLSAIMEQQGLCHTPRATKNIYISDVYIFSYLVDAVELTRNEMDNYAKMGYIY